jgi:hypothetical protein
MTDAEWYRSLHASLKLDHPDTDTYKCVIAPIIKWGDAGNTANNRSSHVCLMSLGIFTAEGKRSPAGKVCIFLLYDSKCVFIFTAALKKTYMTCTCVQFQMMAFQYLDVDNYMTAEFANSKEAVFVRSSIHNIQDDIWLDLVNKQRGGKLHSLHFCICCVVVLLNDM